MNEFRCATFVQFRPKTTDVRFNNFCFWIEVKFPDVLKQHGAGHYPTCIAHKILQQEELPWLQVDNRIAALHPPAQEIHFQIGEAEFCRCLRQGRTTGECSEPCMQLRKCKGLDEIIVATGLEPGYAVVYPPACG